MLDAGLERLLALPDQDVVLDVGAWAAPLNRADWVIDVMPNESRGVLLPGGVGPVERTVRDRFRPSTLELRATALRDRLGRSVRWRVGSLRERVRAR